MNHKPLIYHQSLGIAEIPYDDNIVTPLPQVRKFITGKKVIERGFQALFIKRCQIEPDGNLLIKQDADWIVR